MPLRAIIPVLDAAHLARSSAVILELDTPNPVIGVAIGMMIELVFKDGKREMVELKALGFASSSPERAHIMIGAPKRTDVHKIDRIEVDTLDSLDGLD